jgi:hypothetical protein
LLPKTFLKEKIRLQFQFEMVREGLVFGA